MADIFSAGAVIVRPYEDHYLYLLLLAFDYWDFPKGQTEKDETMLDTAIREIREETTITDLYFRWGYPYWETPPYFNGRKIARYYLAQVKQVEISLPINPEIGIAEHTDYRWMTRKEALDSVTPRVRSVIRWSDQYLLKGCAKNVFGDSSF